MRIHCPWCGSRDRREFIYHGDATVRRPAPDAPINEHIDFVYMRDNPRGLLTEYWHHAYGCRSFVKVVRDTKTHEIHHAVLPQNPIPSQKKTPK